MFCGSVDGKNVDRNEVNGGPACQVSEGSRDSVENLCVIYLIYKSGFWSAGLKNHL